MHVVVTGASGVLGRRVVRRLTDDGARVVGVAHTRPEVVRSAGGEPAIVDLFDPAAVGRVVKDADAVLDLATSIPSTRTAALPRSWRTNDRLRRTGAAAMADAAMAAGVPVYVRESIAYVLADGGGRWLGPDSPVDAVGHTASAVDAERAAARVAVAGGRGVALRFGLFVAPDSNQSRDLVSLARRGLLLLPGPHEGHQPLVHLDDAADAVLAAMEAPSGVHHVVGASPRRSAIAATVGEVLGRRVHLPPESVCRLPSLRALDRSWRVDTSGFRAATGWSPQRVDWTRVWSEVAEMA